MPKKPCQWCGVPVPSGWSDHRCPEMEAALADLKAAAGVEDEGAQDDEAIEGGAGSLGSDPVGSGGGAGSSPATTAPPLPE